MANKKITELTEETSPQGADLLALVDDVSGTPTTKKVTVTNLMTQAPVQAADISGFATQVSLGNHESLTSSVHGISAFGATLVDDADASAARTTLGLGTAATTASSDYATAAHTHALDDLSDVSVSSPSSQDVVKWTGSQWEAGQVSVDVDTPLNTALRGTTSPHIGAYPNQSFKVTDNPNKSVMVIADADGNLDFLVKTDDANIFLNTPSARKAASFGFSVVEDSSEPDIEVASGGENYSVISGDSDTKGANGLPLRQGFNLTDIGAYPAPILISGGTIA
jgi:hypothetical protein